MQSFIRPPPPTVSMIVRLQSGTILAAALTLVDEMSTFHCCAHATDLLPAAGEVADCAISAAARRELLQGLAAAMDRARRAGKPLIISRLPPAEGEAEEAAEKPRGGRRADCVVGAPALLAALTPIVRARFAATLCPRCSVGHSHELPGYALPRLVCMRHGCVRCSGWALFKAHGLTNKSQLQAAQPAGNVQL